MTIADDLPALHDAILVELELKWEHGTCRLTLARAGGETAILTLLGVRECSVPREQPWGPSIFVNKVSARDEGALSVLVVEMQSGDSIRLIAEQIELS